MRARAGRRLLRVLAAFALVMLALLAWLWAPDRPLEALRPRWAPPPSEWTRVGGLEVHLRDEGPRDDPLPIVLIHGTSSSLHTWDGWAEVLRAERRVLRFDLPGFGLTGPSAEGDYRGEALARFVLALLDQRKVARAVLVGNSLGGMVAWEAAVLAPERVAALVLIDSAGYPPSSKVMPLGFRLARVGLLRPLLERLLSRGLIERSLRQVYGDPEKVTPALIERYYELTLRAGNRRAVAERFAQSEEGARAPLIRRIRQPTLILWGGKDDLIPPEHAALFARDIPGSVRVDLPLLGHVPHEEDPTASVQAALPFLRKVATATAA